MKAQKTMTNSDDTSPKAMPPMLPAVSIESYGTAADAAREWEKAAFNQARRANAFEAALLQAREIIERVLDDQRRAEALASEDQREGIPFSGEKG